MRADRPGARALLHIALLLAVVVPAMPGRTLAATAVLDGSIVAADGTTWSDSAVAVVTLVDMTAKPNAGAILGQQRIDAAGASPIAFDVLYDDAKIVPKDAYGAYAAVVDGDTTYATLLPVPVLTGGPGTDVELTVEAVADAPATISGTVSLPAGTSLSSEAVATEVLIKEKTGTLVGVRTIVDPGAGPISYSIGYEPDMIDPEATYVVRSGVVDGGSVWGTAQPVVAIDDATAVASADVAVEPTDAIPVEDAAPAPSAPPSAAPEPTESPEPTPTPTPEATATPTPTPTPAPTPEPTPSPTPEATPSPTPTPEATPTPTPTPEATPTPTPTPEPTPTPQPTATPAPSPSPSPTPTPTPSPTPTPTPSPTPTPTPTPTPGVQPVPTGGSVTGTLSYVERASLSPEASAIVVLVEHGGDPITARIIESRVIADPGPVPIAYELPYTAEEIDAEAVYTVSATIVDGSRLWATDNGTRVITYGNPTSDVALELVLRSDLLKGQVTGEITGEGVTLTGTGFAAAVLFDATSNATVGMAVEPAPTGVPIDFSVPFDPAEIDDTAEYVVVAGIVDEENRWANRDGVPVITNGNPLSAIVVPVTAVEPSPSPEATADSGLSTIALIILVLIIAGIVAGVVWYLRSRSSPPPDDGGAPPEEPPSPEATPPEAADEANVSEVSPAAGSPVEEPTSGADAPTAGTEPTAVEELPGTEAPGPDETPGETREEPPPVA